MSFAKSMRRSSPPLRVYSPQSTFAQLKLTCEQFLANAKFAGSKGQVQLPALMELYEDDFIKDKGKEDILTFVREHLPPAIASKQAKLLSPTYKAYLNDI